MNQIIDNNKLLTEFMNDDTNRTEYDYHKSWDRLMTVIKKINILGIPTLLPPDYYRNTRHAFLLIQDSLCGVDIKKTYKLVIDFIKMKNNEK